MRARGNSRGMTLIELMIVIVIVAILASIAVPNYRRYVMRAQRTEAKTALLRVQAAEEKFYLQNNAYTNKLTDALPGGLGLPQLSENGNYTIALNFDALLNDQGFVATATPATVGQQADTDCALFQIDHTGNRQATPAGVQKCWR